MTGYLQAFVEQFDWSGLLEMLLRILSVLICLTVHETCHGLAAYAMGDPTARRMKRLSFNPIHHIDWIGLAAMVLCGFGWAKPVPVDMRRFKNPRLGMAVTALAGPVSNFILALTMVFGASVMFDLIAEGALAVTEFTLGLLGFLASTAFLSIGLGLFNLIPIPPLDGSKVLFSILPERAYYQLMRFERYGMLILVAILWLGIGGNYLTDATENVFNWMLNLFI